MVDAVDDEVFEVLPVPDDGPVEELAAKRADPTFGERIRDRSPDRRFEDLESFGAEDFVEAVDELTSTDTDPALSRR